VKVTRRGFLAALAISPVAASVPLPTAGLAFHRDAFALAAAPLTRLDVLFGWATLRSELACRITDVVLADEIDQVSDMAHAVDVDGVWRYAMESA
jgi:hypothetical protein